MRKKKILLVDDSETYRELARFMLESRGYEVVALSSPFAFGAALTRERPDLALVDAIMPALQGDQLVRLARQNNLWDCPIVLHSDRSARELQQMVDNCGATGYLSKTSDAAKLAQAVEGFLKDAKPANAARKATEPLTPGKRPLPPPDSRRAPPESRRPLETYRPPSPPESFRPALEAYLPPPDSRRPSSLESYLPPESRRALPTPPPESRRALPTPPPESRRALPTPPPESRRAPESYRPAPPSESRPPSTTLGSAPPETRRPSTLPESRRPSTMPLPPAPPEPRRPPPPPERRPPGKT